MTTKHTFCRICEAHCGLTVELNDDNTVTKIRPDKAHPISQGFVCAKGLKFGSIADHPERLLHPQKRAINGNLERISWETAFSDISAQLKHIIDQHGKHAVAIYFGTPMIHNALGVLALHQWAKAIGTRNVYSAGTQDNANKFPAQNLIHGSPWIMPIFDLEHAEFAVIIGANPALSQGTFVHMEGGTRAYDDFLARGGEFAIIDPRYSESAQRWGGHIPIRPLTDPFLLLALLNECRDLYTPAMPAGLDTLLTLAEQYPTDKASPLTGIPSQQIKTLAEKIRSQRTTFMLSIGVNQGAFGTLSMVAMQALAYLTGNFDVHGGLLFNRYARFIDYLVGLPEHENRITGITASAGGMPCGALPDEILTAGDGQIKALIVIAGNPLTSTPDENRLRTAFSQLDLLVSLDIFENHTGELADYLLPGSTWLERYDMGAWDAMYETTGMLQSAPPTRPLPADCRTEAQIIAELSWRSGTPLLGSTFLARQFTDRNLDTLIPKLTAPIQKIFAKRLQNSDALPWFKPRAGAYAGKKASRLRFWDADLLGTEPARLATFATDIQQQYAQTDTLLLIGRRRRLAQNSWVHNAGRTPKEKDTHAWLTPDDMARFNLKDGDCVQVQSSAGTIELRVATDDTVMHGTITIPHGLPEVNANALVPSDNRYIEPTSGMHRMNGIPVTLTKIMPK